MTKGDQIKSLGLLLRADGYTKKGSTWHRSTGDGVHVVNVQGSQWGSEYYLNLGFYLHALGEETTPAVFRCHVRSRLSEPTRNAITLAQEIKQWFQQNGTVEELLKRYHAGSLPGLTLAKVIEYLEHRDHPC